MTQPTTGAHPDPKAARAWRRLRKSSRMWILAYVREGYGALHTNDFPHELIALGIVERLGDGAPFHLHRVIGTDFGRRVAKYGRARSGPGRT